MILFWIYRTTQSSKRICDRSLIIISTGSPPADDYDESERKKFQAVLVFVNFQFSVHHVICVCWSDSKLLIIRWISKASARLLISSRSNSRLATILVFIRLRKEHCVSLEIFEFWLPIINKISDAINNLRLNAATKTCDFLRSEITLLISRRLDLTAGSVGHCLETLRSRSKRSFHWKCKSPAEIDRRQKRSPRKTTQQKTQHRTELVRSHFSRLTLETWTGAPHPSDSVAWRGHSSPHALVVSQNLFHQSK